MLLPKCEDSFLLLGSCGEAENFGKECVSAVKVGVGKERNKGKRGWLLL